MSPIECAVRYMNGNRAEAVEHVLHNFDRADADRFISYIISDYGYTRAHDCIGFVRTIMNVAAAIEPKRS